MEPVAVLVFAAIISVATSIIMLRFLLNRLTDFINEYIAQVMKGYTGAIKDVIEETINRR